ncbi:hypothetical protein AYO21_07955 [Fonsecaea monophora]|uniref:Uncharacterized protein n=1 Tax=Fonsecaea monophora TaxID=254056 RepID=A0A177F3R6_9EURO|nr:hypothetical protein AYO21_07955 [Fonsecaea monophora]OAG37849.1 hypothetical protein AYO21_07955 [Fonsecaea monophora]
MPISAHREFLHLCALTERKKANDVGEAASQWDSGRKYKSLRAPRTQITVRSDSLKLLSGALLSSSDSYVLLVMRGAADRSQRRDCVVQLHCSIWPHGYGHVSEYNIFPAGARVLRYRHPLRTRIGKRRWDRNIAPGRRRINHGVFQLRGFAGSTGAAGVGA